MSASSVARGIIAMRFADVEPRAPSSSYNVPRGARGPTFERPTNVATLARSLNDVSYCGVGPRASPASAADWTAITQQVG